ncbi:hypothetical protein [Aerosakkonema funiforme]|uniref:Uncharacterized protein n=1 Tax=Aerosakkonema funiforme FACHB-1375 TaxID=2949571 RepID=A0A926ZG31_9CYAN|nr:hypothetical protein [Aerosakkonema funiforme]MBD2181299.1 hypothetical protein [Aerosakkonema funiforme FACHB-1375]
MTLNELVNYDRNPGDISTSIESKMIICEEKHMEILAYLHMVLAYEEAQLHNANCTQLEPENCQNIERENAAQQAACCDETTKKTPCHLQAAEA